MIKNRLEKNLKRLRPIMRGEGVSAWRLYDRDIPEYPYIVECFEDQAGKGRFAVVWSKEDPEVDSQEKKHGHRQELLDAVGQVLEVEGSRLIFKERRRHQGETQYERMASEQLKVVIAEGPLRLKLNLTDYLDTGLFLDHRPLRRWVKKECSPGSRFLNLFSYTCSVSAAAALGGAHTTSVDLSQRYLDWGRENFALCGLSPEGHLFVRQGAREFLAQARAQKMSWDLIYLDPPTFSNSKRTPEDFDVQRDHPELIIACLELLAPGGKLYFSTNKRRFKLAAEIAQLGPLDLGERGLPVDFHDHKIHKLYAFKRP